MRKTTNYGLSLYDAEDKMSITAEENSLNANMEIIDKTLKEKATIQEISEEYKKYVDDTLEAQLGSTITLTKENFIQGLFTYGTGFDPTNKFWITANPPIPVKAGEKVFIKTNGCRVQVRLLDNEDMNISTIAKVVGTAQETTTEEVELTVGEDGWLLFLVYNTSRITPETYVSEITIGETELEKLEKEIETVKEVSTKSPVIAVSPKYKPFTKIINDCQTTSAWRIKTTSTDIATFDTTDHIMWNQSLHSDNEMRYISYTDTYDLLNNDIVFKLKFNSIADGARLHLLLCNKDKPSNFAKYEIVRGTLNAPTGVWVDICIPYNTYYTITATPPDFTNINDIYLTTSEGVVDYNLQFVGLRSKALNNGIVTFTFDDGYKSQYTGLKILAEKGITGTIYPSSLTITDENSDCLSVEKLQELVNYYGSDIGVHHSITYDQMTIEELKEHWEEQQRLLKDNGLGEGKHMAYPGGRHPAEVVQLAKNYFTSCRTINSLVSLETYPPADAFRLRDVSSVGASGNNVDYVKDKIDKANASGSWLILVFHKIEDGDNSMYCTEDDLKAIADYAIASGAKIMNMAEVYDSVIHI